MLKVLELFGGIGACTNALRRLEISHEVVDYVEIDKFAVKSYNAIYGTNFEPQDIQDWDKDIEVDLIMHGSPCQDFSIAGLEAGGEEGSGTRSSLMWHTVRIARKLKPKYIVWENVKNVLNKNHKDVFEKYLKALEEIGYRNFYKVLNVKDFGIPQNRERIFVVSILGKDNFNFSFPTGKELKLKAKDLTENNVEEKYFINTDKTREAISKLIESDTIKTDKEVVDLSINAPKLKEIANCITTRENRGISNHKSEGTGVIVANSFKDLLEENVDEKFYIKTNFLGEGKKSFIDKHYENFINNNSYVPKYFNAYNETELEDIAPTQNTTCGLSTSSAAILINTNDYRIRKLTPRECWRLMGFRDEDFDAAAAVCSNTQLYKQAGNSIVVNVLIEIFKELFK